MNDMMNEEECSPMAIMASKKISIAKPMNELDNYYKILNDYASYFYQCSKPKFMGQVNPLKEEIYPLFQKAFKHI